MRPSRFEILEAHRPRHVTSPMSPHKPLLFQFLAPRVKISSFKLLKVVCYFKKTGFRLLEMVCGDMVMSHVMCLSQMLNMLGDG